MIQVKDLENQIGVGLPQDTLPLLCCFNCGGEYSANSGDYFNVSPDYILRCCGMNVQLVTKQTVYKKSKGKK